MTRKSVKGVVRRLQKNCPLIGSYTSTNDILGHLELLTTWADLFLYGPDRKQELRRLRAMARLVLVRRRLIYRERGKFIKRPPGSAIMDRHYRAIARRVGKSFSARRRSALAS